MEDNNLSPKHELIADLYASGCLAAQIASQVSTSVTTVYRILRKPSVRARVAEARAVVLRPILELVQDQLRRNVAVLAEIRDDVQESARNKIAAVAELNQMFYKLGEIAETKAAVAHLEAALPEHPEE